MLTNILKHLRIQPDLLQNTWKYFSPVDGKERFILVLVWWIGLLCQEIVFLPKTKLLLRMKKLWKFYFNIRNVGFAGHFINTRTYCFRTIQIQGMLGLQIYMFTGKAANVVKAAIFEVHWVLAWWEKALSVTLSLFYLPSTSQLLAYLGILWLTTWKAF